MYVYIQGPTVHPGQSTEEAGKRSFATTKTQNCERTVRTINKIADESKTYPNVACSPFGYCSPTKYGHPQVACQQKSSVVGQAESLPYPGFLPSRCR